jgi:hypothetical protein
VAVNFDGIREPSQSADDLQNLQAAVVHVCVHACMQSNMEACCTSSP